MAFLVNGFSFWTNLWLSGCVLQVWLYDWWLAKVEGDGLAVSGFTFRDKQGINAVFVWFLHWI